MSVPRIYQQKRGPNRWNAFLRRELQLMNDALPEGATRYKIGDGPLMAQLLERWNAMDEEERVAATEDKLKEMVNDRELKETTQKTSPLAVLTDVRRTLGVIEKELANLHQRTGVEVVMLAVRNNHKSSLKPHTFCTSDRIPSFWEQIFDVSLPDIAVLMEAHFLAQTKLKKVEVDPPKKHTQVLHDLKQKTGALILAKFKEISGGKATRMNYQNFDAAITSKFGITIENWPLATFRSPSDYSSKTELETLFAAWESGTTSFRQLSPEERSRWDEVRTQYTQNHVKPPTLSESPEESEQGQGDQLSLDAWDEYAVDLSADALSRPPSEPSEPPAVSSTLTMFTPTPDAPRTQVLHLQPPWPVHNSTPEGLSQAIPTTTSISPTQLTLTPAAAASSSPHSLKQITSTPLVPPHPDIPTNSPETCPSATSHEKKKRPRLDIDGDSIGTIGQVGTFSMENDGQQLSSFKKPRKERADKGKKRGPNKRSLLLEVEGGSDNTVDASHLPTRDTSEGDSASQSVLGELETARAPLPLPPPTTAAAGQPPVAVRKFVNVTSGDVGPGPSTPAADFPNYKYTFKVSLPVP
ncbi:hypothetical protein BC835DRAFT_1520743 [Cytidiella melzeri]|nr:hypothetical protein BC835DRAFT_1520743 [Cytidiella melzeri]